MWERNRRVDGVASMAWSLAPSTTRAQRLQEVTPRRTVVGLVAALDHDDDAAIAAADDGLALAKPAQRVISTV